MGRDELGELILDRIRRISLKVLERLSGENKPNLIYKWSLVLTKRTKIWKKTISSNVIECPLDFCSTSLDSLPVATTCRYRQYLFMCVTSL